MRAGKVQRCSRQSRMLTVHAARVDFGMLPCPKCKLNPGSGHLIASEWTQSSAAVTRPKGLRSARGARHVGRPSAARSASAAMLASQPSTFVLHGLGMRL